jgi:hypothetical protein
MCFGEVVIDGSLSSAKVNTTSLNIKKLNAGVQGERQNLLNSLMFAQQWDQLDDMGKLTVLTNMYSAVDTLGGNRSGEDLAVQIFDENPELAANDKFFRSAA